MFLIMVFQYINAIPMAEEVFKIVTANREAYEIEMQQVRENNEKYWKHIADEIQTRRDEAARLRELARPTINQVTFDFCESKKEEVTSWVLQAIESLTQDFNTGVTATLHNAPRDIAYCMVKAAMNAHFYAEFNFNHAKFMIAVGRPADESKIVMEKPQMCGDTLQYAVLCDGDKTDCMLFQMEFNQCAAEDWDTCMNPLDYGAMHQFGSFSTGFTCL